MSEGIRQRGSAVGRREGKRQSEVGKTDRSCIVVGAQKAWGRGMVDGSGAAIHAAFAPQSPDPL